MRTALFLLLLLALGAMPGSVIPQQNVDALATQRWQTLHPHLTPVYDKLGLFAVYGSAWFSAIYLLLMVSLVGCIIPRLRIYWRNVTARPPKAPRNLSRLPEFQRFETTASPADVARHATTVLRGRRFRTETVNSDQVHSVAAQRGYLREAGNLLFHLAVVAVLLSFAYGSLFGFKGGVIVIAGQGFNNTRAQYDDFAPGGRFNPSNLVPFNFSLDKFQASFLTSGPQTGMPTSFTADLSFQRQPGDKTRSAKLEVNHPLAIDGTSVFLVGHGYAPIVTVRDGTGQVAYSGPTVFLPQDSSFASFGVIKVADAQPQSLGFEGMLLPTYGFTMQRGPYSRFPDALAPVLTMKAYRGDLGLDNGTPQSVYVLRKQGLREIKQANGKAFRVDLPLGATRTLPGGAGSITFDGVQRFAKFQISRTPGESIALGAVALALMGLLGSLFIRPRRVWVRARSYEATTLVEVAGLDKVAGGNLAAEIDNLKTQLLRENS